MPIYEYRCSECEQIFEEWQKNFEEHDVPCPVCGHKAKRIISNTTFVLKGSGWYVTDYCQGRNHSAQASSEGNGDGNGNGNGNGKKAKEAAAAPPKKTETVSAKTETTA